MIKLTEDGRYIDDAGREYARVSEIYRPLSTFGDYKSPAAAQAMALGTAVHKVTELYDLGELDEDSLSPVLKPFLQNWKEYQDSRENAAWHGIEEIRGSEEYGYAGTIDRITDKGVLDIKTGRQVYPWTAVQLAAYAKLIPECHGHREVVWLRGLDGWDVIEYPHDTLAVDWRAFEACLIIHEWKVRASNGNNRNR